MKFNELQIKGVFEVVPEPKTDSRGFFMRIYDEKIFESQGLNKLWVQESHSFSKKKGTVRGIHFQYPPFAETKLIRVVKGRILITAVDLRYGSGTLGHWVQIILSSRKKNLLYIPKGFGTAFCTLTQNVHMIYKMDSYFSPEHYDNIKWDDPDIGINWPIKNPADISERDANAQNFKEFVGKKLGIKV